MTNIILKVDKCGPKDNKLHHSRYGVWHGYYVIKDIGTTTYYRQIKIPRSCWVR